MLPALVCLTGTGRWEVILLSAGVMGMLSSACLPRLVGWCVWPCLSVWCNVWGRDYIEGVSMLLLVDFFLWLCVPPVLLRLLCCWILWSTILRRAATTLSRMPAGVLGRGEERAYLPV